MPEGVPQVCVSSSWLCDDFEECTNGYDESDETCATSATGRDWQLHVGTDNYRYSWSVKWQIWYELTNTGKEGRMGINNDTFAVKSIMSMRINMH